MITTLAHHGSRALTQASAQSGQLAQRAVLVAAVAPRLTPSAHFSSDRKPLHMLFVTKSGQPGEVRRPEASDKQGLVEFYGKTPQNMFHFLATLTMREEAAQDDIDATTTPGEDAAIAVVRGEPVGVTRIRPEPGVMEPPFDEHFVAAGGWDHSSVCTASTIVTPTERNQGVATVLKKAQREMARELGYQAVVTLTHSDAIKRIVEKQDGGYVQTGVVYSWTSVPTTKPKDEDK